MATNHSFIGIFGQIIVNPRFFNCFFKPLAYELYLKNNKRRTIQLMKALKPIVILALSVLVAFSANAQVKDEAFATDPAKAIHLFPNPAVDVVSVRFETPLAKTAKVSLHNIIGNEIQVETEIYDEFEIHLKIKDLPTGYYLVTVKQEEGNHRSILKFLKR